MHPIGVAWARANLKMVRVRIEAQGQEHIVPAQPYVLMANHQSHLDIWALFDALPIDFRWVMKQELGRIPVFGAACARAGYIFVQRGNSESAARSMALAAKRIAAGATVVFFPEGTRSRDGLLGAFKSGGFRLAIEAGVPILPVSIDGTARLLPRGEWRYRPGVARVTIGVPIPTRGCTLEDLPRIMETTRDALLAGMGGHPRARASEHRPEPRDGGERSPGDRSDRPPGDLGDNSVGMPRERAAIRERTASQASQASPASPA